MGRLVVVSNRVPSPRGKQKAGGLAAGLWGALRRSGGLWFGWSGEQSKQGPQRIHRDQADNIDLTTVDLTHQQYQDYYLGASNRVLWPVFHNLLHHMVVEPGYREVYREVNQAFARRLVDELQPDDTLWVHDYHLIPLGRELRELGVDTPIGFFLHIPFPPAEVAVALPWHEEAAFDLCHYDLVGFQSRRDSDNFHAFMHREMDGMCREDRIFFRDRVVRSGVFPIGIDVEFWRDMRNNPDFTRARKRTEGIFKQRRMLVGASRLDYTKGLPQLFTAFERLLDRSEHWRRRAQLIQVASPSRQPVSEYREFSEELAAQFGRINSRAMVDWAPIRYLHRFYSQPELAALHSLAAVGVVPPLRDGMNLVAKEFVAAQDPEDPGALVLSMFTGAAAQLTEAVMVNPYDTEGFADALDYALRMPRDERIDRWRAMYESIEREDIGWWRDAYLRALRNLDAA